jgi:hypothetical protein
VESFDTVMAYADHPAPTVLKIGAGTGKATRPFAPHDVTVTATGPGGSMLAELRRHAPPNAGTVQAAFEDLRPGQRYGPVHAAAAVPCVQA